MSLECSDHSVDQGNQPQHHGDAVHGNQKDDGTELWDRIQSHRDSIKSEMDAAVHDWTCAQRALWREKSMARREHRKPDVKFAKAWLDAESRIDALRIERKLYTNSYDSAGLPAPTEFQYDAAARALLGPHYAEFASQSSSSVFPRPP